MAFIKTNIGFFIGFLFLGAILGSAIGTLVAKLFPSLAIIKANLTGPIGFNLEIINFSLKLNFSAIIGILLGFLIYRKI